MNTQERKTFRKLLLKLRERLASNIGHMQSEALRNGGKTLSELSDTPIEHLADRGSDNFAKELIISVLQNSEAEVCDIDAALAKLEADTYGVCENCNSKISKSRLKALPFARLCIECQQTEELHATEA